MPKRKSTRK